MFMKFQNAEKRNQNKQKKWNLFDKNLMMKQFMKYLSIWTTYGTEKSGCIIKT